MLSCRLLRAYNRKYYNHLKRINTIAFKNTNTTKEIIKHQLQLNEFSRFKDLNRQFLYKSSQEVI